MPRSVPEWCGATADTAIPTRVRLRVWDRAKGLCHRCGRKIRGAIERWVCEHLIALINWRATDEAPHGNRERNLGLTCENCLPIKNAEDVAEKSEVYELRRKHILPREKPKSVWKRKVDGTTVRRA